MEHQIHTYLCVYIYNVSIYMCVYVFYVYICTEIYMHFSSLEGKQYFQLRLKEIFQLMWANERAVDNTNNRSQIVRYGRDISRQCLRCIWWVLQKNSRLDVWSKY